VPLSRVSSLLNPSVSEGFSLSASPGLIRLSLPLAGPWRAAGGLFERPAEQKSFDFVFGHTTPAKFDKRFLAGLSH
jgi:hypothetical protein